MSFKMLPTVARIVTSRTLTKISGFAMNFSLHLDDLNLLTNEEKEILSRNAIFKDRHKGQRGFVIVNGPSLKKQDIRLLNKEITFVVSGFWKHPVIEHWQPTYYSILDKNFFTDEDSVRTFFAEMNNRIKESTFFLPLLRGYDFNKKHGYVDFDKTYYIAANGEPFPSVDLTSLIQGFAGVSAFALAQAIYMGCNPIYLLGFDHDYLANRGVDHHFYDGGTIKDAKNASVPLADRIPYDVEMEANLRLWKNYRSLQAVAEKANIKIFNATMGGYLDVFDRVSYEEIITPCLSHAAKLL